MPVSKSSRPKLRDRILYLLKTNGPQEAGELAEHLGVTAMAVRQHLYRFQNVGWVSYDERSGPTGRPAKVWTLTEESHACFPDRHHDLLINFIDGIENSLGPQAIDGLLEHRADRQIQEYRNHVKRHASLAGKIDCLAKLRSTEGYMAHAEPSSDGGWLLIENHCPVCHAAKVCNGLCDAELTVFRKTLGPGLTVERTEHILAGDRRCAYHIRPSHETQKNSLSTVQ